MRDNNDDFAVVNTVQIVGKRADLRRGIRVPSTHPSAAGFRISTGPQAVDAVIASFSTLLVFNIYLSCAVFAV